MPKSDQNPNGVKMYAEPILSKVCKRCGLEKSVSDFYIAYKKKKCGSDKPRDLCKPCERDRHREWVNKNKSELREYRKARYRENKIPAIEQNLKRYYGLTMDDYNKIFLEQNGKCAICGLHQSNFERRFDVDHNHDNKKIRGLLCIRCNRGIGLLRDSIEVLESAVKYLKDRK
jgi:hypothetical protein